MAPAVRRIGILAGGGTLPLEFARSAAARGELAHIVAIDGAADADFGSLPVTRVGMGQVGRLLRAFRDAGATDIVIIGPARRPDLKRIVPDLGFFLSLPAILRILSSGGDDGVLTGVVKFFEGRGFRVLGPAEVAPEALAPAGPLTGTRPCVADASDIGLGFRVIRLIGDLDVGQAVIVTDGRIEAIEGAEGTDAMLARVAARRGGAELLAPERKGLLVKRPKPGQELRVDMPSIGPGTATAAGAAGLRGIAVHAGNVLVAERAELLRCAEAAGLFVAGVGDGAEAGVPGAHGKTPGMVTPSVLGRITPDRREICDVATARAVMLRLAPFDCGHAVAVTKGYVLAVEAGREGARAVLDRVRQVRSRGGRNPGRAGAVVVSASEPVDAALVEAAALARLAGIAVCGSQGARGLPQDVIKACDRGGMFIARIDSSIEAPELGKK